jgi:hypothetical protein
VRTRAVVALTLALAGCGGGGSSDKSSSSSSDPCARPAGFHPLRAEVPSGIAPDGTLVNSVRRTAQTISGDLFFPEGVVDTYAALRAGTSSKGYESDRVESEGFEAEVEVRKRGDELRFKVTQIQGCSSASRGHFTRKTERD